MKGYPLFIKGNNTGWTYIRYEYNKKHNYAMYYSFIDLDHYVRPQLSNESEHFHKGFKQAKFDCKQLKYCIRLKIKRVIQYVKKLCIY